MTKPFHPARFISAIDEKFNKPPEGTSRWLMGNVHTSKALVTTVLTSSRAAKVMISTAVINIKPIWVLGGNGFGAWSRWNLWKSCCSNFISFSCLASSQPHLQLQLRDTILWQWNVSLTRRQLDVYVVFHASSFRHILLSIISFQFMTRSTSSQSFACLARTAAALKQRAWKPANAWPWSRFHLHAMDRLAFNNGANPKCYS